MDFGGRDVGNPSARARGRERTGGPFKVEVPISWSVNALTDPFNLDAVPNLRRCEASGLGLLECKRSGS